MAMIKVSGMHEAENAIDESWLQHPVSKKIVETMQRSRRNYEFNTVAHLAFRIELGANIVKSAHALDQSGVSFASFYDSTCNERYWDLTDNGGFKLKANISPSAGLQDIYQNGTAYAFECATAMVILLYKAVLDSIGTEAFNRHFPDLLLWDWQFDDNLGLTWQDDVDHFPGDVRYFKNPDVDPVHIQWQGENVIDLGDGTWYGHGIGIGTSEEMIAVLNQHRTPGAEQHAFLMPEATRPDFHHLSRLTEMGGQRQERTATSGDAAQQAYVTVHIGDSMQVL